MYFLDTCAMIEYAKDNPGYVELIKNNKFYTSNFQLMELYYISLRDQGKELAEKYFESFSLVRVDVKENTIKNAMQLRLTLYSRNKKISYVDALGYQYGLENKLKFVTCDLIFEKLENVEFIPELEK